MELWAACTPKHLLLYGERRKTFGAGYNGFGSPGRRLHLLSSVELQGSLTESFGVLKSWLWEHGACTKINLAMTLSVLPSLFLDAGATQTALKLSRKKWFVR